MTLAINPSYELYECNGQSFCSSRQVAETFGKRHDHVLVSIQQAIDETASFAPEFSGANFIKTTYRGRGKNYPQYLLTKDGFTYVTMKFTGEKAAQFRVAYIKRFNDMESFIKNMLTARMEFPEFAEAVMDAHEEPKSYHYSNECDMINRIVLGVPAKAVRERYGLPKGASIRPCLDKRQIEAIVALQRADIGLLAVVPEFGKRREVLTGMYQRRLLRC